MTGQNYSTPGGEGFPDIPDELEVPSVLVSGDYGLRWLDGDAGGTQAIILGITGPDAPAEATVAWIGGDPGSVLIAGTDGAGNVAPEWRGPATVDGTAAGVLTLQFAGPVPVADWTQTVHPGAVIASQDDGTGNLVADFIDADPANVDAGDVLQLVDIGAGVLNAQWLPIVGTFLPLAGGTMTGPILGAVGTAALPGYSFDADPNTGIYRPASDVIGLSVAGVEVARVRAGGLGGLSVAGAGTSFGTNEAFRVNTPTTLVNSANALFAASAATTVPVVIEAAVAQSVNNFAVLSSAAAGLFTISATGVVGAIDGVIGTPGYGFIADPDTGIYRPTTNVIAVTAGGNEPIRWDSSRRTLLGDLGSAGAPVLTFVSDTNTGIYSPAADQIGFTAGGTLRASVTTTALAIADGINITIGAGTGTKIGTGAGDKLGFLGATPQSQLPPSGASGHATGSGTAVLDLDTFTGAVGTAAYTIGDLVTALKLFGFINTN